MKPSFTRRDFLKLGSILPLSLAARPLNGLLPASVPTGTGQNVLIVIFDALSALNVQIYGYARETMPNLERPAKRAIVYHQNYAGSNFTSPGTASLLTGTLPWTHMTIWIALEALINMTVMVGLMPFAGNALPFISAGGSNLVSTLCAVGIMLNVSRQCGESVRLEDDEWTSFGAVIDLRWRNGRRGVSRDRRSQRPRG